MFRHQLRMAWRSLLLQRGYSAIHILGLSVGVCACIVIYLITRYEFSFDDFHPGAGRIYRIVGEFQTREGSTVFLNSPFRELAGVEHLITGFEAQTGFHIFGQSITVPSENGTPPARYSGRRDAGGYTLTTVLTGPDFFNLFPHEWLLGSPAVLDTAGRIVLSESVARKYFGPIPLASMLDRIVIYEDSLHVRVGGIVKDWDRPSDLDYTSFISISTAPNSWLKGSIPTSDWSSLQPRRSQAFVRLAKDMSPQRINAELQNFIARTDAVLPPGSRHLRLYLQSLRDMHYVTDFHPIDSGDDFRKAWLPLLYALMGGAFFILVLAIINFINLSTAQSFQRMKEVGIRKIMGSSRKGLILQFLIETGLLTTFAVLLSVLLVWPALRLFRGNVPAGVQFHIADGKTLLFLAAMTLFTSLMAGFYPARLMSSYLPALSLKGSLDKSGKGGANLRRVLIVFQFTLSLMFTIGSLVISRQMRYMRNADKGFDSKDVVTVDFRQAAPGQMRRYADQVRQLSDVREAIIEGNPPMGRDHEEAAFIYRGKHSRHEMVVDVEIGDDHFIPFYQMHLVAGGNIYSGENVKPVIINETYARLLGFNRPSDALMAQLYNSNNNMPYTVMGIVTDYHQISFHETPRPLIIITWLSGAKSVAVRLGVQGEVAKKVVARMESVWKLQNPGQPFNCTFLNDAIMQQYNEEGNTALLMQSAMVITILISCMGLFGLALFSAGRRAKEIGIRKVMGATVTGIALLLSGEFLLLVLTAIVIASPLAWYLANTWLRNFAYRTTINAWVLVEAGLSALVLALFTVGFQAVRAARLNPVKVLRVE
jgi:hypothetical protein